VEARLDADCPEYRINPWKREFADVATFNVSSNIFEALLFPINLLRK